MSSQRNVEEAWVWIVRWLGEQAPKSAETLRPGVPKEQITRAEQHLGFPIHPDLRTLWGLADGVADDIDTGAGAFLDGYALMPIDTALELRDDLADSFDGWGHLWLPITTNEVNEPWMGATINCDGGRLGAWSMEDEPQTPGGTALAELLGDVIEALEPGTGRLKPRPGQGGTVPGLADGALIWADPVDKPALRFPGWAALHP
ncbi:SMI1/KNR4 family protein [Streptomyces sp. NBC_00932]|uniref:SMI1/KNR4 family protein n=1 Tax=Streptomyces sp. NBC_00932 TaxID=2903690 RepID=UPI003869035E|nr:hypothetical protein OG221_33700 [Streptomyces sp. NBC_00932]